MRCDECLPMLDQYVEGEFDKETAKSVAAHLMTCSACAGARGVLLREQEIYASYLFDVEPPEALWARLRLELDKEKAISTSQPHLRLQRWLAIALGGLQVTPQLATALVLVTIGLAIGIMVGRRTVDRSRYQTQNPRVVGVPPSPEVNHAGTQRDSDDTNGRSSANGNDGKIRPAATGRFSAVAATGRNRVGKSARVRTVDQAALSAERQYLSAIQILSRDIRRRRAVISPELLSQLDMALAGIDRTIAATRKIARAQPRDPVAVQYLALAYEKKVDLLREVSSW